MNYIEIESYFEDEKKCEELLKEYEIQFTEVDMIAEKLINGDVETEQEIKETLMKLTGLYMTLNIVAEIADTAKVSEEGRSNFARVKEYEDQGKKPIQTQIDKQVSADVQFLRRVRNIFAAYRDSADKAIGSCQSRLKRLRMGKYQETTEKEDE